MRIRKGDTVIVISGKDKGEKGKVRLALPSRQRVVIEGINMIKRHTKPQRVHTQAGIIEREAPLGVSKVMLICNKCDRPTRVALGFVEEGGKRKKVRVCRLCGEVMD